MIKTKRWDDPVEADDGTRILVTRYRPRALRKVDETWHEWDRAFAPSPELHAAFYGKHGEPISWTEYTRTYLAEMRLAKKALLAVAQRIADGETLTFLCSSHCTRESRCHRSLLRQLVEAEVTKLASRQLVRR